MDQSPSARLRRIVPGLAMLRGSRRGRLRVDVGAGLSARNRYDIERGELYAAGVRLVIAGAHARVQGMLERLGGGSVVPTLRSAVEAFPTRERVSL